MASARSIEAGRAHVRIGVNDRLTVGLKKAQRKMQNFASGLTSVGTKMAAVGAGITAPLALSLNKFAEMGDQLDKMSKRTGISVESLSELGFAAEQSGASLEAVGKAVQKMNRRVGRLTVGAGSESQVKAVEELGLSIEQLSTMNPEERFLALGEAIASYGDDAAAAGLAQRAFGTEVDKLLPLFKEGAEGMAALRKEAQDLGITLTTDDAAAAAAFTDAFNRVRNIAKSVALQLGAALAPAATRVANAIKDAGSVMVTFVKNNRALVTAAAAAGFGIIAVGAALVTAGLAASALSATLGLLTTAYGIVTGAASAAWTAILGPFGLVIAAFAALLAAMVPIAAGLAYVTVKAGIFGDVWSYVAGELKKFWGIATATFGGIKDALMAGEYLLAAKTLWAGLKVAFYTGLTSIRDLLTNSFSNWWDAFKRFGKTLLQTAWDVFKALPGLLWKALSGGSIAGAFAGIFDEAAGGLDAQLENSQRELGRLKAEAEAARKAAEAESAVGDSTNTTAQASPGSMSELADALSASQDAQANATEKTADEVERRIKALREEVVTMKLGKDAAERWKLEQMGATEAQLRAVEAAQRHRNAIEAEKKRREEAIAERERHADAMKAEADRINEEMRAPMEVFRDEVMRLRKLRNFGLTDDAFEKKLAEARERFDEARDETDAQVETIENRGTFSGFTAGMLGGPRPTEERIAKATEQTATWSKRTAERIEQLEAERYQQ